MVLEMNINVTDLAISSQHVECKQTSSDLSGNFECSMHLWCRYNIVTI
jgi:hypothetical protein